jgi:hypothetical protein
MEAAFVIPLFLFLISGMIDLGYAGYQTSQATAAARDGARAGILDQVDDATIEAEVRDRLTGPQPDSIDIECLDGLSGPTVIDCDDANPNEDRIRVGVAWAYEPVSFVGGLVGIDEIRGTATMVIVGRPIDVTPVTTATTTTTTIPGGTTTTSTSTTTTTAPPGSCQVNSITFIPAPLELGNGANSAHLKRDTSFTVTTNGAATCTGLKIEYPTKSGPTVVNLGAAGAPTTWTDQVSKNEYEWNAGAGQVFRVLTASNQLLRQFTFTIS